MKMEKFKVYFNEKEASVKIFNFSGGEVQVKVSQAPIYGNEVCRIEAHVRNSDDLMTLLLLTDAIRRDRNPKVINLVMPYLPYARQDRVCASGEALALKVCTDLINGLKFDSVQIWDCHSDVGVALLDNCVNRPQKNIIPACQDLSDIILDGNTVLVSPDAGANKKTLDLAWMYGGCEVVRADKVRNAATGKITGTEVYGDVSGKVCVIVDDIADKGGTFMFLSDKLREKGAAKVILYVTHAILPDGFDSLMGKIDELYVANCFIDQDEVPEELRDRVNYIKV
jgi:ribose-phosphate pyrophosphokinase